jgi:hypothetical protein
MDVLPLVGDTFGPLSKVVKYACENQMPLFARRYCIIETAALLPDMMAETDSPGPGWEPGAEGSNSLAVAAAPGRMQVQNRHAGEGAGCQ